MRKKVILTVINDLTQDQRLHKICTSLKNNGFEPLLVGTKRKKSLPLTERGYETKRLNIWIHKGALSYAEFNIRLFFYLLFQKFEIITSNDLDTLLPCYWISKLKGKRIIYDSHEYFTEQPELTNRSFVKKVWTELEEYIFPKLESITTVNQSLADIYSIKYNKQVKIVRNLPYRIEQIHHIEKNRIVIYQGNVNVSRGVDIMIKALQHLDNVEFWCVGPGDILDEMKTLAANLKVSHKIKFWGQIPFQELKDITLQASLGISIEQPIGLNSTLCLPNKLLDYIQCRIPVIVSDLPEMRSIVNHYVIGTVLATSDEKELAKTIENMLNDSTKYSQYVQNCELASRELCWENEEKVLLNIYIK